MVPAVNIGVLRVGPRGANTMRNRDVPHYPVGLMPEMFSHRPAVE